MSDSTYANSSICSIGKNRDSSGIYFDSSGKPLVTGETVHYKAPTVDIAGSIKITFDKLKTYPSYRVLDNSVCILKTEFGGSLLTSMNGVMHDGNETTESWNIQFEDNSTGLGFYRIWSQSGKQDVSLAEWRLPIAVISQSILDESKIFREHLLGYKAEAENQLAKQKKDILTNQADDVNRICDLLGISTEDAAAYLAAGHTVKEAADKVSAWNLADPSARKAMIARDALRLDEATNKGEEFSLSTKIPTIKYEAQTIDDMYKEIRNPYTERKASKAYIALVKESLSGEQAANANKNQVLLKLQEFYMQSVNELDSEKYQIVETFNKPKIYFFDRRARIYQYSFIVENTGHQAGVYADRNLGNPWRDLFKNTYDQYLRGTKSVENRVKAVIHFDEVTRVGYVLSCNMSMDANNDNLAQVSITMFVEDEQQRNVIPTENKLMEKDVIKKAEAKAIESPFKVHILGKFTDGQPSQNISCPDISNINKESRQTFDKPKAITISLINLPVKESFRVNGENTTGNAQLSSFTASVLSKEADGWVPITEFGIDPSGIFLTLTSSAQSALRENSPFDIPKTGVQAFVVFDKTSKTIQDLQLLFPGEDIDILYNIQVQASDNKDSNLTIGGKLRIKSSVLDVKVSSPGNTGAKEFIKQNKTVVEMDCVKAIETENKNGFSYTYSNDRKNKIFKGNFEIQLFDSKESVAIPDLKGSDTLPLKMSEVVGSINKDSKEDGNLNGFIKLTPKDAKTFTCDVTINALLDSQNIVFSAESCIMSGELKVGNTNLFVKIKFIRDKDVTTYKLIKVHSAFSKEDPIKLSLDPYSLLSFSNVFTLIFEEDPGKDILSLIQYDGGKGLSNPLGYANVDIILRSISAIGYTSANIEGSDTYAEITSQGSVKLSPQITQPIDKASLLSIYGIASDKSCYIARVGAVFSIGDTVLGAVSNSALANSGVKSVSSLNVTANTTNIFAKLDSAFTSGSIKIAKTSHTQIVTSSILNTNTEKTRVAVQ